MGQRLNTQNINRFLLLGIMIGLIIVVAYDILNYLGTHNDLNELRV
jgi:hypothetical protein